MSRKRSFDEINIKDHHNPSKNDSIHSTNSNQLAHEEEKSMKIVSSVQPRSSINSSSYFSSLFSTSLEEYYANLKRYNVANLELPERDRWEKMNKSLYGVYFSLGNSASEFQYLNRDDASSLNNENVKSSSGLYSSSSSNHHLSHGISSFSASGSNSSSNRGNATQRTNSLATHNTENNMNQTNINLLNASANITSPVCTFSKDQKEVYGDRVYRMARASHGVHAGNWYYEVEILKGPTGLEYDIDRRETKRFKNIDQTSKDLRAKEIYDLKTSESKIKREGVENQNLNIVFRLGWASKKADVEAPVGFDQHSYALRSKYGARITKSKREDDWTLVNSKINISNEPEKKGAERRNSDYKSFLDDSNEKEDEEKRFEDKEVEELDVKYDIPLIGSSFGAGDILGCAIFLSEIPLHLAPQEARRNKKDRGQNDAIVEGGLASQLGILIPSSTDSTPESIMDEKKESGSKSSTNGTQEKDMVTKIIKENQNLETENDDGSKKELNNEKSSINLEVKTKGIISDDAQVPEGINSDSFRQQNGDPDRQGLQILNNIEKQIEKENNDLTIANDIKTPNNKMAHQKLKHNDNYYFGNHIRFYKNGKDLGVAFCHLPPGYYTPAISIYGGGGGLRANFGPKWIAVPEHLKHSKGKQITVANIGPNATNDGRLSQSVSTKMGSKSNNSHGNPKSNFHIGGRKKTGVVGKKKKRSLLNEGKRSGTPFASMGLTQREKVERLVKESLDKKILELKEHDNIADDEGTTKLHRSTEDKEKVDTKIHTSTSIHAQEKYLRDFEMKERIRIEDEEKRFILKTIRRTSVDDSVREKLKPVYCLDNTKHSTDVNSQSTSLYSKQDRYVLSGAEYSVSIPYQPINDLNSDWCQEKKSELWKSYNDYIKHKGKELRSRLKEEERRNF